MDISMTEQIGFPSWSDQFQERSALGQFTCRRIKAKVLKEAVIFGSTAQ